MADRIRARTLSKLQDDVRSLGGADLETLGWLLVSLLEKGTDLLMRGHDDRGHFIKGVVDSFTADGEVAVECGAGRNP